MIRNRISFVIVGVIFLSLLFFNIGKTESNNRWILYGKVSELGDLYYDKSSIKRVRPNVIKVWTKLKVSKVEKNKVIQNRIKVDLPTNGWEKLSETIILYEVDCLNNTIKLLKIVDYNDEDKILSDIDYSNSKSDEILPESIHEGLRNIVCQK